MKKVQVEKKKLVNIDVVTFNVIMTSSFIPCGYHFVSKLEKFQISVLLRCISYVVFLFLSINLIDPAAANQLKVF